MKIHVEPVTIAMATPFRISRGSRTECHVVRVTIEHLGMIAQENAHHTHVMVNRLNR